MKEVCGNDSDWIKKSVDANFSPACFDVPQSHKFVQSTYPFVGVDAEKSAKVQTCLLNIWFAGADARVR